MYSFIAIARRFDDYQHSRADSPQAAYDVLVEILGREPDLDPEEFSCWQIPREADYEIEEDGCPIAIGGNGISTRIEWLPGDGDDYFDPTPTTPWGAAINEKRLAPGIMADWSERGGGLVLSTECVAQVKELFPSFEVDPLHPNCFSDAADFAAVVFAFPQIATDLGISHAIDAAIENGLREGAASRWREVVQWLTKSLYSQKFAGRVKRFDPRQASLWIIERVYPNDEGDFAIYVRRGNITRTIYSRTSPSLHFLTDNDFVGGFTEGEDVRFNPARYKLTSK